MKKKGKRRNGFENDVPYRGVSRDFEDLISSTDPDALKSRIIETPREVLNGWVEEISGNKPDDTHDDVFVAACLCRYIDGDKNWGDDPRRVMNLRGKERKAASLEGEAMEVEAEDGNQAEQLVDTHTPAEMPSPEEDEMTKPIEKKNSKKKNSKKAAAPKSTPPKKEKVAKPPAEKKEKKEGARLVGKTSGKTRMKWFFDAMKENAKKKLSDEKIDNLAAEEFGAENIPGENGTFRASHMRGSFNTYRKVGRYGLSLSDPEFLPYNEK